MDAIDRHELIDIARMVMMTRQWESRRVLVAASFVLLHRVAF